MRPIVGWMAVLAGSLLAGCGGGGSSSDEAVANPVETPARAGEVWTLAEARVNDAPSPADIGAFVEGLHVFVRDGDWVYAGSLRHDGVRQADGSLQLTLSGGRSARLAGEGEAMTLQLGEGAPAQLVKRADPAGGAP